MKDKIEEQIIEDVKSTLAEIDIQGIIDEATNKKRIKEIVTRYIDDEIYRAVGTKLMLIIRRSIDKKSEFHAPFIEQEVFKILAERFNL